MVGGAGALVSGGGALVGGGEGALLGVNLVTTTIFVKNKNYKVKTIFNTSLVGRGNAKGGPRPTTFKVKLNFIASLIQNRNLHCYLSFRFFPALQLIIKLVQLSILFRRTEVSLTVSSMKEGRHIHVACP